MRSMNSGYTVVQKGSFCSSKRLYRSSAMVRRRSRFGLSATVSCHAGFGFDWGVRPSSVKVEFERRRSFSSHRTAGDLGYKLLGIYSAKFFNSAATIEKRQTEGWIGGIAVNYYSPYRFYYSVGVGAGFFKNLYPSQPGARSRNFVWINHLGYQFAPYFLRKDKLSLNMDLYTIFSDFSSYNMLPSFGLTYYRTLG